jgi:hypothetical protein
MENTSLNNFEISFALDKDVDLNKFLVGKELENRLNENLILSNYTTKFSTLFMIFQCFEPENPYFNAKDYKVLRRKTQSLELYSLVDYNEANLAGEKKMKSLLCDTYLKSVETHLKGKDFAFEQFIKDLTPIFETFIADEK